MATLDRVDVQILALLQENGRISQNDLAKAVGLSSPAVGERVRKLEERGILQGVTAVLSPRLLGLDITAFVAVTVGGSRYFGELRARIDEMPEVLECHSVTGQGSHLLKIRVSNTAALEQLLAEIQSWPGVQGTATSLVLSTLKETSSIALPALGPEGGRGEAESTAADLLHVPFRHHP